MATGGNGGPPRKRAKTSLTEWSQDQWDEFREMYERYVFLWKEDVRGYSDDDEKNYMYKDIATKMNDTGKHDKRIHVHSLVTSVFFFLMIA